MKITVFVELHLVVYKYFYLQYKQIYAHTDTIYGTWPNIIYLYITLYLP